MIVILVEAETTMRTNLDPSANEGKSDCLAFDAKDYGIKRAHYEAIRRFLSREAKSVRNSAKWGGHRSREDLELGLEVLTLVRAVIHNTEGQ